MTEQQRTLMSTLEAPINSRSTSQNDADSRDSVLPAEWHPEKGRDFSMFSQAEMSSSMPSWITRHSPGCADPGVLALIAGERSSRSAGAGVRVITALGHGAAPDA